MAVIRKAIRSVPGCGEVWAKYIRAIVSPTRPSCRCEPGLSLYRSGGKMRRTARCKMTSRTLWQVGWFMYQMSWAYLGSEIDVYAKAFSTSLVQKNVEQVIPIVLAKAGYEKRRMKGEFNSSFPCLLLHHGHVADKDGFDMLIKTLEDGISIVRNGMSV